MNLDEAPMKCPTCRRLSLKPCRASALCVRWAEARARLDALAFRSDGSTRYSRPAGKFIVPLFSEAA